MLALSPSRKARIEARITSYESQVTALETAIATCVSTDVQTYDFNSGDGEQRVTRRTISEMRKELDILYRLIEHNYSLLRGRGIVQMKVSRW